jgi:NADPH:quinone reductase-like Zn-dependent oxidoreductase
MKAIVHDRYGPPDVLELRDVQRPAVGDDDVLVRVRAASVNPLDWYGVSGIPYVARVASGLRRPKSRTVGVDLAGTVEAAGRNVTLLRPGDEVFGTADGAFAEYVAGPESRLVPKPANLTFEQAAASPVAGLTALQGLRDKGRIRAGQRVLIIGASGGVGTFAVQIAKSFGAEVTGVCSPRNVDAVRSLGADHVIDYTRDDFAASGRRFDLILDVAGNRSVADRKRVLESNGTLVLVGGPKRSRMLGPLGAFARVVVAAPFGTQTMVGLLSQHKRDDLLALRELLAAGTVKPVIERTYALPDVPESLRYLGEGHAQGKLVITVAS